MLLLIFYYITSLWLLVDIIFEVYMILFSD